MLKRRYWTHRSSELWIHGAEDLRIERLLELQPVVDLPVHLRVDVGDHVEELFIFRRLRIARARTGARAINQTAEEPQSIAEDRTAHVAGHVVILVPSETGFHARSAARARQQRRFARQFIR